MQKYGSKRDKALATKGWTAREGLSVWEAEQVMNVKLFLEGQTKWEADCPHCLMMLCEMFQHAVDQGWKEAECTVCWGCQHKLPKLDPEVDISAIQLVGPETSKEEIQSLYLEVYKLWRLLGSPPGEPELMEEVVSSFEEHQGWKQREAPEAAVRFQSTDIWPPRSRTPRRGRREDSVERSLAKVREAHQKALAMAAALEEEIEWLSCPLIRSQPEVWACSKSRDCHVCRSRGQKRRHPQVWPEDCCAPILNITPPEDTQSLGERQWLLRILIWRNCQNWGQRSPAFSEGQLRIQKRKMRRCLLPSPQWKSSGIWWCGRLKPTKCLAGGGSWWQYQG